MFGGALLKWYALGHELTEWLLYHSSVLTVRR